MKTANATTDRDRDFHGLSLPQLVHRREGRGAFMVTQEGCDPGDPALRFCPFALTTRRTWLHFYLCLALPESVRQSCAHVGTRAEFVERADSLPGKVIVENAASLQELIHEADFEPDAADATGQPLLRELKRRHEVGTEDLPA